MTRSRWSLWFLDLAEESHVEKVGWTDAEAQGLPEACGDEGGGCERQARQSPHSTLPQAHSISSECAGVLEPPEWNPP